MLVYSQEQFKCKFAGPEREINAKEITIIARKDNNNIGRKPESSLVPVWGGDMN